MVLSRFARECYSAEHLTELESIRSNSKCLADRTYNYYQMGCKKLGLEESEQVLELYKTMRIDAYLSSKNPLTMAACLLWFTAVRQGANITVSDVLVVVSLSQSSSSNFSRERLQIKIKYPEYFTLDNIMGEK